MISATDVAIEEGREQERAHAFACIAALLTAYREKHGGTGEYGLALEDLRTWLEQPAPTGAIFAPPAAGPVTTAVDAALAELRRLNGGTVVDVAAAIKEQRSCRACGCVFLDGRTP